MESVELDIKSYQTDGFFRLTWASKLLTLVPLYLHTQVKAQIETTRHLFSRHSTILSFVVFYVASAIVEFVLLSYIWVPV